MNKLLDQLGGRKFVAFIVIAVAVFIGVKDLQTLLAAATLYIGSNLVETHLTTRAVDQPADPVPQVGNTSATITTQFSQ